MGSLASREALGEKGVHKAFARQIDFASQTGGILIEGEVQLCVTRSNKRKSGVT